VRKGRHLEGRTEICLEKMSEVDPSERLGKQKLCPRRRGSLTETGYIAQKKAKILKSKKIEIEREKGAAIPLRGGPE